MNLGAGVIHLVKMEQRKRVILGKLEGQHKEQQVYQGAVEAA